ncbi:SDR family oxidoreductase [Paenibacillus eucommiae]|uniref:NAD(P)-dependent dehydrogenase (Short-subunit alcohol dehydrogenase family) n=1 Tax=Paenibacillus eucommiae TaxID=1355755 RepID=A0ABS4IXZ6_9BACL|nr:SDR family oxidoreductase [Paenibacillus eucommiae]MBP1992465.1 NAD(P)-dependent dehydrogenase (short-subunit alcohol dehydrogenase family) [Paenibacillus eucommiae]
MTVLKSFSLEGKVALVTGGAGKYGRQIVQALAEAGAITYFTSSRKDQLLQLEESFRETGHEVKALYMDQGIEATVLAARDQLEEAEGRIDILINNAVARTMKNGWAESSERFAESMNVNATGLFVVTRAFGDRMAARQSGSIINIGSMYGMVGPDVTMYEGLGTRVNPDYFFNKAGMINFTRFTASQYGSSNVRCNCISPGGYWTPQAAESFVERYEQRTLLGRMANDTDLKGVIVFLASDASKYITAANIPVDGGYTAK